MRIAIIGGGASGFMAAITAKESNIKSAITIFEKTNKPLSKVKISGGGRCNVTNATYSISKLINNYPRGGSKLKKSFSIFNTNHTVKWFENRGVKLKTESDRRVFPTTNNSQTIIDLFEKIIKDLKISLFFKSKIISIQHMKNKINLNVNNEVLEFDRVIIASGGIKKINKLDWLNRLKFKINQPVPSLFTFNIPNNTITELMGLSVPNAIASIEGCSLKQFGPLLITHWGMSGPAILKLSAWGAIYLAKLNYNFITQINWLGLNEEILRAKISKLIVSKKLIFNLNPFNIPKRLWYFILNKVDITKNQTWMEISKKKKNQLINTLINDKYLVKGKTTFKEEFVTCGGIDLSEINMLTMESRQHKGIYVTGELLDIDGVTGGFNFQAAWTTGYLAGKNSVL